METWGAIVKFVDLQPGNATRYCLMVTPINGEKASKASGMQVLEGSLITWLNGPQMPSMLVSRNMYAHFSYVASKMRIGDADAEVIANFINNMQSETERKAV